MPVLDPLDVEGAKQRYCSRFVHVGCGGHPIAWIKNMELGCTKCKFTQPCSGGEPLGESLDRPWWETDADNLFDELCMDDEPIVTSLFQNME